MSTVANIPRLIEKKRNGGTFTYDEIEALVSSIYTGTMQPAQIGALLMAIRLKDMNDEETIQLTKAMVNSGEVLNNLWPSSWRHLVVDKHSTGGVGDKISLVLAPALAACGLKVPMISGRGLGHTGGTLDKLEAIPGFNVSQSKESILEILDKVGCCIVGQTQDIVPADRVMYAIRDVTATVDSIPLITGSIVSKKAAEGLAALVLDIKIGKAAVSQDDEFMRKLARTLVSASNGQGMKTTGLQTKMDSPVGNMVGNSLEVIEAIRSLHGHIPRTLKELVTKLGGHLLKNADQATTPEEGAKMIENTLVDGTALDKFRLMMRAQGVAGDLADQLCKEGSNIADLLPKAKHTRIIKSPSTGYVSELVALECAHVCIAMGAGRTKAGEQLDYGVGLEILIEVGDHVKEGDDVMVLHYNDKGDIDDLVGRLERAIITRDSPLAEGELSLVVDVLLPGNE